MKAPANWDEARAWEDEANRIWKHCGYSTPLWSFDCGFKLDYDGPMVQMYCRFYPPTAAYEEGWDGAMELWMGEEVIWHKNVGSVESIDELKDIVEGEAERLKKKIIDLIRGNLDG